MSKIKNTSNKRLLLNMLAVALLLGFSMYVYAQFIKEDSRPTVSAPFDLSPASIEDQNESDKLKEAAANTEKQQTTPPPSGDVRTVQPVIVDVGQYGDDIELRSYVSGVVEDNGTCTAIFTKGGLRVSRDVRGSSDATVTQCSRISLSRTEFSEYGAWSVVLNYISSSSSGTTSPTQLEVK